MGKFSIFLKGNTALEGHVSEFGYFGLKKFLDPELVYGIQVISIVVWAKTQQKRNQKVGKSTAGIRMLRILCGVVFECCTKSHEYTELAHR